MSTQAHPDAILNWGEGFLRVLFEAAWRSGHIAHTLNVPPHEDVMRLRAPHAVHQRDTHFDLEFVAVLLARQGGAAVQREGTFTANARLSTSGSTLRIGPVELHDVARTALDGWGQRTWNDALGASVARRLATAWSTSLRFAFADARIQCQPSGLHFCVTPPSRLRSGPAPEAPVDRHDAVLRVGAAGLRRLVACLAHAHGIEGAKASVRAGGVQIDLSTKDASHKLLWTASPAGRMVLEGPEAGRRLVEHALRALHIKTSGALRVPLTTRKVDVIHDEAFDVVLNPTGARLTRDGLILEHRASLGQRRIARPVELVAVQRNDESLSGLTYRDAAGEELTLSVPRARSAVANEALQVVEAPDQLRLNPAELDELKQWGILSAS